MLASEPEVDWWLTRDLWRVRRGEVEGVWWCSRGC